ncbi:MAG: undecaprenyldiphospho-muramoylpentapeptide beta-N-acetylglucosaminyltransferase [Clostridiales bacterium]|nr:undecaprenyldiphospho-muramoylpentapeptide beta-N-acetylglucosaminyltransferase [Clostridiales bacterium]
MKKIILTGGGTAGHVTPNIALLPLLAAKGYTCVYVGSRDGIERELILKEKIPYFAISAGKLRRYLDARNVTDLLRVIKGLVEAHGIISREKPDVIFSKGGFVAVPVVAAGWLLGVPVVIHESDITPGLANRLCAPFAAAICAGFPETLAALPKGKTTLTGTPIRGALFSGDRRRGLAFCGFSADRPVALVMGGSSGAVSINNCVRAALPNLLRRYQVAHICGRGNLDDSQCPGRAQFEYLSDELPHVLAAADVVVSRAGANAISEFLALRKPALLIPLPKRVSRGDQILNAESFKRQGFGKVLYEGQLTPETLMDELEDLYRRRDAFARGMERGAEDAAAAVVRVIAENTRQRG